MNAKLLMMLFGWIIYSLPVLAFSDTVKPGTGFMSTLSRVYGEASIGGGYQGVILGLGGSFFSKKTNWGVHYFGYANIYRSINRPADFIPSSGFNHSDPEYPNDNAVAIAITVAKEFPTKNKKLRFLIAGGPCFTQFTTKSFKTQRNTSGYYFGNSGNYEVTKNSSNAMGIALKASVGYMSRNRFGQQLSVLANWNEQQMYAGVQLDILFGKVW